MFLLHSPTWQTHRNRHQRHQRHQHIRYEFNVMSVVAEMHGQSWWRTLPKKYWLTQQDVKNIVSGSVASIVVIPPQHYSNVELLDLNHFMFDTLDYNNPLGSFRVENGRLVSGSGSDPWIRAVNGIEQYVSGHVATQLGLGRRPARRRFSRPTTRRRRQTKRRRPIYNAHNAECQHLKMPRGAEIIGEGAGGYLSRIMFRGRDSVSKFIERSQDMFDKEVAMQRRAFEAAPNHVPEVIDSCHWGSKDEQHIGVLISPYLAGGTFADHKSFFSENRDKMKRLIDQLSDTVMRIHEAGLVHRDINHRNVMFDKNPEVDEDWTAYLIDYGSACEIGSETCFAGYYRPFFDPYIDKGYIIDDYFKVHDWEAVNSLENQDRRILSAEEIKNYPLPYRH
jgi:hypothetical protein